MIVVDVVKTNLSDLAFTNISPFTYQAFPGIHATAQYWTDTFGCPDESVTLKVLILSFYQGDGLDYIEVFSEADCKAQIASFYFDGSLQVLDVHFAHEEDQWSDEYFYGTNYGFTDREDIYIDDLLYQGLISSFPTLQQQQDLQNYDKLAFVNGSLTLQNSNGVLDFLIGENIYGNHILIYWLAFTGSKNYSRTELVRLQTFYIEDYNFSIGSLSIVMQDIRKAQNIKIPTATFEIADYQYLDEGLIGKIIPLIYGQVRYSEAFPVNSTTTGTVTYRQAIELSAIGTVQILIDELWTTIVPDSVDLTTGSFVLTGARNTSGVPYQCRVYNSIGIANTYAPDCIVDLNERYLGIVYTASSYDTTEWEAERVSLAPVGVVFDTAIELYEAIRIIQNGSSYGFRYEISGAGLRTIRLDDRERTAIGYVPNTDLNNILDLQVASRSEYVAGKVKIKYSKDWLGGIFLNEENDDFDESVFRKYRQRPTLEIETLLVSQSDAEARALEEAEKYSEVPRIAELIFRGEEYYSLRVFDILEVAITTGFADISVVSIDGRQYFGIWKVQILSVSPDYNNLVNKCSALLVEEVEPVEILRVTTDGAIRQCGLSGTTIIKRRLYAS